MTKSGTPRKLLLGIWLLFCGCAFAGLMFVIELISGPPYDPLPPILIGVVAIPFIWMLSSGWQDSDAFRKALRMYVKEHEKRDA
jgi:hypothetical protein